MRIIELVGSGGRQDSRVQRWAHFISLTFCLFGILIGVNLRNSALTTTTLYVNNEAGIRANYPAGWLIDSTGSYVFRVQDVYHPGFKTSIQIEIFPFTSDMQPINVLDDLSLSRAQVLSTYNVLSIGEISIDDVPATLSEYVYVHTQSNPFTQSIPIVVYGQDILVERRGQAILISFRSDINTQEENLGIFEQFLETLEF